MSDSMQPHRWQPTRLPFPWDSPGKSTGVGCHCLLRTHQSTWSNSPLLFKKQGDFPESPVVGTLSFQCREHRLGPWSGIQCPSYHVAWPTNKQRSKHINKNYQPICYIANLKPRNTVSSFKTTLSFLPGSKLMKRWNNCAT